MKNLSKSYISAIVLVVGSALISSCNKPVNNNTQIQQPLDMTTDKKVMLSLIGDYENRLNIYFPVTLSVDLSHLSANQKKMLAILIEASVIMDDLFWQQAFDQDKNTFLSHINDSKVQDFAVINYGPWDRLNGDLTFLSGTHEKRLGAQFYPPDMTKEEFDIRQRRPVLYGTQR